jgi:hypothetical protein
MSAWISIACRRDVVIRALRVAVLVGTILVAINQGDALLSGTLAPGVIGKIVLTYCVPYAVSTYASVAAIRAP